MINLLKPKENINRYDALGEINITLWQGNTYALLTLKKTYSTRHFYYVNKIKPVVRFQEN